MPLIFLSSSNSLTNSSTIVAFTEKFPKEIYSSDFDFSIKNDLIPNFASFIFSRFKIN